MATAAQLQVLYITYFGRPADPEGLQYWLQNGASQEVVANGFATTPEYANTIVGNSVSQVINSFYENLFGRSSDPAGLAFWTSKVNDFLLGNPGGISLQQVGRFIADGALTQSVNSPDRVILESKIAASALWTSTVASDATFNTNYNGALANTFGVNFLESVVSPVTIPDQPATNAAVGAIPPFGTIGLLTPVTATVSEGGSVIFQLTTIPIQANQTFTYQISGAVTAADFVGGSLTGLVTTDSNGVGTLQLTIANDALVESTELFSVNIQNVATSSSVSIIDTTVAPAAAILTTSQDISGLNIVAPTTLPFTYFANEETLGQSDQLSRAPGSTAEVTLNVGTQGSFNLRNFSTDGIQTLELRPSGENSFDDGDVDLQASQGLRNINVSQSQLDTLTFSDIQSADNFATNITDSFSTFNYNFDVNALLGNDAVTIRVRETPIDATTGAAVGFDFTQGPLENNASIEGIDFFSNGAITNVVNQLSVGDDLDFLQISGNASLDITTDLGLSQNGNREISAIDASGLSGNLTLSYTSILGDIINNVLPDVVVLGAAGDNLLTFGTQSSNLPTDFSVVTLNGNDSVTTVGGDDDINVGAGDNSVVAGDGQNTITAGTGDDTIDSGTGADLINAGAGNNSISSAAGNDTITSLGGDDTILAGQGDDNVDAGDGANLVFGDAAGVGAGNDTIRTGSGADFIVADALVGGQVEGAGNDSVDSGSGNDTVFAGSGSNTVDTGEGNDLVVLGTTAANGPIARTPQADTFANTVFLGEGNDRLRIDTDSLTNLDLINGGDGFDTIELFNGGTLLASETLRVSRIEALDLRGFGDYAVTLTDELVRTSDQFVAESRRFSVLTSSAEGGLPSEPAGNVTLDLSFLTPVDAQGNLLSIRYSGQSEQAFDPINIERVIIRDGLINDQTFLEFGEASGDRDETFADILQILDSADVTADDLVNVSGLEVIELTSSVNGPQTFSFDFRDFTLAQFNSLVGDGDDILIIRATPLLAGAVSTLNLDLRGAAAGVSNRIRIEESANLNVFVQADPGFGVPITTALFYTPNADNLIGTNGDDTFIAFQLSDVQAGDFADGQGGTDTLEFRFAPANAGEDLEDQLARTVITGIEIFRFNPAAVNQPVRFDDLGGGGFATGLQSIFTSGGDDFLVNIDRSLFIDTGAGNDFVELDVQGTVVTGFGDDSVLGSTGNDSIITGPGNDFIDAIGGNDFIDAGEGNDFIDAGSGNDTIAAGAGNNTVTSSAGLNSVTTGDGDDSIVTGTGNDTIDAGDGTNTVNAGAGLDSVITGSGADSINTAAGTEVQNDTVRSGDGNDTVFVGLGDDLVDAGDGDDVIVLSNTATTGSGNRIHTDTPGGFTPGDRIDGGLGFDTLVFSIDSPSATTTVTGLQVQNIERINVAVGAANQTLVLDTTLLTAFFDPSLIAPGRLQVNLEGDVLDDGVNFTLNATSFVQGEAVDVFTTGLDTSSTYLLGAGNDTFTNFVDDASNNVSVAGNGGSDTINLVNGVNQVVQYNTGNDGGIGGSGTGGDFITGYNFSSDSIDIAGGLLIDIGGRLSANVTNSQLVLGSLGDFVGIAQTTDTGRNILSLTGPARSLTDIQLKDAEAIAQNINGVGVRGNGRDLGDSIGTFTTVTNVTNQALIVQQGATQTALYLYIESSFDFETARAYTVQAHELRQLGVFDNALFTGTELI